MFKNLTIKQIHQGLVKKKFSCQEITDFYLQKISQQNKKINAFITVDKKEALEKAKEIDLKIKQGKKISILAGVPCGIKDVLVTNGLKTTAGSKILADYVPPFDATAVAHLRDLESIFLGKTNCDEFAMGSSNEYSAFGSVKNPIDTSRVAGGSSGGSAAAVADDECVYALGTDTGGSVRQPASFCGVVGLKPTYGRVSRYGLIAMASSLDQVGILSKKIEDSALILENIAGQDKYDATTSPKSVDQYSKTLTQSIKGLKIGVPKEYFVKGLDIGVDKSVRQGIEQIEKLGAKIVEISLPHTEYALAVYYIIMPAEVSANLARFDGVRYGLSDQASKNLLDRYKKVRGQGFGSEVRRRIMLGTYALSAGYYDAYYKQAQKVRTLIQKDFDKVFTKVDCLVTPTVPDVAFKLGNRDQDPLKMYLSDIYTVSVNLAGLPAVSVPCGLVDKLPIGLQIIGKPFAEATILNVAYQYEQSR